MNIWSRVAWGLWVGLAAGLLAAWLILKTVTLFAD